MKTSQEEKLRKVRILYERSTNPGEKAAAYEALKRMTSPQTEIPLPLNENWSESIVTFLTSKGFWNCCTTGDRYLYTCNKSRKVWVNVKYKTWEYYTSGSSKRVIAQGKPDAKGNTREHLIKILS